MRRGASHFLNIFWYPRPIMSLVSVDPMHNERGNEFLFMTSFLSTKIVYLSPALFKEITSGKLSPLIPWKTSTEPLLISPEKNRTSSSEVPPLGTRKKAL
jgi:hypothetical protein